MDETILMESIQGLKAFGSSLPALYGSVTRYL